MFGPPGVAYVYLVYGMHNCLNVVSEPDGQAGAVLIRAIEPIEGVAAMRDAVARHPVAARRAAQVVRPRVAAIVPDHRLGAGPGRVAACLSVDRQMTGLDLCDPASPLHLELADPGARPVVPVAGPRIGVAYAGEPWSVLPLRLVDASRPSARQAGHRPPGARAR